MQKTKIDWPGLAYAINHVTGCKNNCPFDCYARRLNKRFKFVKDFDNPEFNREILNKIYNIKKPSRIFMASLGELFGNWVPHEWIEETLFVCKENPQHEYMFLTKNPNRYAYYEFTSNMWVGASICDSHNIDKLYNTYMPMVQLETSAKKFLSIEPITGSFSNINLDCFDLIIVGAMTGKKRVVPEMEWVNSINHNNIWYKENILKYFPDLKNNIRVNFMWDKNEGVKQDIKKDGKFSVSNESTKYIAGYDPYE